VAAHVYLTVAIVAAYCQGVVIKPYQFEWQITIVYTVRIAADHCRKHNVLVDLDWFKHLVFDHGIGNLMRLRSFFKLLHRDEKCCMIIIIIIILLLLLLIAIIIASISIMSEDEWEIV